MPRGKMLPNSLPYHLGEAYSECADLIGLNFQSKSQVFPSDKYQ